MKKKSLVSLNDQDTSRWCHLMSRHLLFRAHCGNHHHSFSLVKRAGNTEQVHKIYKPSLSVYSKPSQVEFFRPHI